MPIIYLSPSTQEYNPYVNTGTEESWMNRLADAMEPILNATGIRYDRNTPDMTAASSIAASNAGSYDLHLALHSNASPDGLAGSQRGVIAFYYPGSYWGMRAAQILAEGLKAVYPLPDLVRAEPSTSIGEVRRTRAPAVLLELGFHDNRQDADWIIGNLEAIAANLVRSLAAYFGVPFFPSSTPRTGTVETVDWENPVQSDNGYYYGGGKGEMESSSKYPFYVTLDDDTGLKLGQHVYIEPGIRDSAESRLMLPAWFISDADSKPWVWAADGDEKLEKRELQLGEYDADTQCWEVRSGLSLQDYLATPDDNCREGAPVVYYSESDFERPDPEDFGKIDFGGEEGKENEGGEYAVMPEGGEFGFEGGEFGFEGGEEGQPVFEGAVVGDGEDGKVIYGGADVPAGGWDGSALPTEVSSEAGGAAG